jgi:hypothetical protein
VQPTKEKEKEKEPEKEKEKEKEREKEKEKEKEKGKVIYTAKGNTDGKNKAADKLTPPLIPVQKAADKPYPDIYNTDEYLFPAGPYYNVRAGRTRLGDRE